MGLFCDYLSLDFRSRCAASKICVLCTGFDEDNTCGYEYKARKHRQEYISDSHSRASLIRFF